MRKKLLFLSVFVGLLWAKAAAQDTPPDSLSTPASDTFTINEKKGWLSKDYPNPKKALLIGLVVPGGGQMYNKRWYKLPFVYGALTGMVLLIDYNQSRYRRLSDALDLKRQDLPHEFSGTAIDNISTLRSLRDGFDKNTQLSYVGLFIVYALQSIEAFVDAHLKDFDIDDDLGLRIKPNVDLGIPFQGPTLGVSLTIPLSKPKAKPYYLLEAK
ncbi:MAG TPA: DUF5683 domain-containing protein [Saprospiraceae bacterium]|nr:DUF5683 domain-containing protein [Saprospiraceae bacterium]HMQ82124.1 DUF5683 domain-containing protein [Saprospiraceae bacterium]